MMTKHKKNSRKHKSSSTHDKRRESEDGKVEEDVTTPYCVQKSERLGRYLVASKALEPGEIIMEDHPLVVGPCQEGKPLCLGCYVDINLQDPSSFSRCPQCNWPICSLQCPGIDKPHGHSQSECKLLSKSTLGQQLEESWYYAVTPLRCLALKEHNPSSWNIVQTMESHDEARRAVSDLWTTNQRLVVDRIRETWGLKEFTEEEIHKACGVLEVNCFEVRTSGEQSLRAIYPQACLFAHDCVANTTHADGSDFKLTVRTLLSVPKDGILYVSYAYTLQSTLKRRKHLQSTKFFSCSCKRCSDRTELGTFLSALRCPQCTGNVLSLDPLNDDAEWMCTSCKKYKMSGAAVKMTMIRLNDKLEEIDGNDIRGYELFLKECGVALHDNHYLSLSALHSLSQLYGKVEGFLINDLADELLERKISACRQLLFIFSVLEPGLSRQRGLLLYELQAPLMVQLQRRVASRSISQKELKLKLSSVGKYLEEAQKILSMDPEGSTEHEVAKAAQEALLSLSNWRDLCQL